MSFEEAQEQVDTLTMGGLVGLSPEVAHLIIESLQKEYAPTVEMTKERSDTLIMMRDNQEPLVEILADLDGGVLLKDFDRYWEPLTEKQLIQAWLHPETIRVVDEQLKEQVK